ncbi:uncharacterized protein LOC125058366 isoform X1 [Pieris napi]|uniref:uncharacterized protein LOC125058366 isoform X1 n=1 Tax=Pieris napi TaxID=78633 RepID=UPI001FBA7241|nr:uncharacterized protein LOC125058366 isoform X1 [Pieris napi]
MYVCFAGPFIIFGSLIMSLFLAGPSTSHSVESGSNFEDDLYVCRHLYVGEILPMYNLPRLVRQLGTREQCLAFAEEHGLILANKMCRVHRQLMRLDLTANTTVGAFVCSRGSCRAKSRTSRATGTWFEKSGLLLPRIFYLIYCFAHRKSHEEAVFDDPLRDETNTCLSRATITDWYSYCREVIVIYYLETQQIKGKIGGPGKIVQIDESKFGRRKYNKGRRVEGHWVLGMIEDGSEDLRLEVCPDNVRSAEVLVPLIKKHVEVGTTIHTDCWRAYDCLAEHGYHHKKVNHSDPDNPFVAADGTHTQRIESQWRVVKRFFYKDNYNHPQNFGDVIVEYLWRRNIMKNKKDPFIQLIEAIKYIYKP